VLRQKSRTLRSVGLLGLLGQVGKGGSRQTFQASEDGLEFAVLLGGGVVEGRGLGAEFHVDGFAGNLIGPLEVGAVTLGGVAVASTLGPAAFHHSLQNRPFQEICELVEFLPGLAETLVSVAEGRVG
jgi:hypothetical protein